jgi:hypothetical protein
MAENEKTSPELASLAGKVLADPNSSEDAKRLAGSVLTQAPDHKKSKKKVKPNKPATPKKPKKS